MDSLKADYLATAIAANFTKNLLAEAERILSEQPPPAAEWPSIRRRLLALGDFAIEQSGRSFEEAIRLMPDSFN